MTSSSSSFSMEYLSSSNSNSKVFQDKKNIGEIIYNKVKEETKERKRKDGTTHKSYRASYQSQPKTLSSSYMQKGANYISGSANFSMSDHNRPSYVENSHVGRMSTNSNLTSTYADREKMWRGSYIASTHENHTVGHISGTYYPITATDERHGARSIVGRSVLSTFKDEKASRVIDTRESKVDTINREHMEKTIMSVPKKVIREEMIERVFVVPETVVIEVFEEEQIEVDTLVVEEQPVVIVEKTVEIPEIEEVEVLVEQEVVKLNEKIIEQEVIVPVEKVVVNKVQKEVEKIVEEVHVQNVEAPYFELIPQEKSRIENIETVTVTAREEDIIIHKEIVKPDENIVGYVLPKPVEAITEVELSLPTLVAKSKVKKYPVYLPRFIEIPVSRQLADEAFVKSQSAGGIFQDMSVNDRLKAMMTSSSVSLCDIETFAKKQKESMANVDINNIHTRAKIENTLTNHWRNLIDTDIKHTIKGTIYNQSITTRSGHDNVSSHAVHKPSRRKYKTRRPKQKVHNYPTASLN